MLVTLRSFFLEMACLHGEEKGKSFRPAGYLFRKRTRSGKIKFNKGVVVKG